MTWSFVSLEQQVHDVVVLGLGVGKMAVSSCRRL